MDQRGPMNEGIGCNDGIRQGYLVTILEFAPFQKDRFGQFRDMCGPYALQRGIPQFRHLHATILDAFVIGFKENQCGQQDLSGMEDIFDQVGPFLQDVETGSGSQGEFGFNPEDHEPGPAGRRQRQSSTPVE